MKEILLSEVSYITPKQVLFLKKSNINTVEDLLFSFQLSLKIIRLSHSRILSLKQM